MSVAVGARSFERQTVVQWLRTRSTRYVVEVALLAGLYYGAARVGFALNFSGPVAAIVWLPAGVGIAYLYLRGLQFWPGMLIGDLLANNYMTVPVGSALGQTIGNVLEVVVAAYLLQRLDRDGKVLESVDGVARMLVPLSLATTISASVGSISLRLGHVITSDSIPTVWRTWWLGDACGALLVVPLAVAWSRPVRVPLTRRRVLEAILMLATTAALSDLATRTHRPLAYVVFPALIWAALRFGQRGATVAVLVVVGFALWNTTHLAGPFYFHDITRSVLEAQLFVVVAALSALCLAAVVSEREQFAERLGESRAQLFKAADAERQRIERNLHDGAQQRLLALAVHLRLAAEQARRAPEQAAVMIEEAERELQDAFDELRELSQGIHPTVLTDLGLANAIRSVAARSAQSITLLELPAQRVETAVEATGYFVFMEAVANAQKYARASTIQVRARASESMLWIEVFDDGLGGATESVGSGLGGLRDRVEGVGGTFRVSSRIGDGTRICADIPRSTRVTA
jgi:signal transduction histidine kinase